MDGSQRYLLMSALAAANTVYGFRPATGLPYTEFLSLLLTWPTTELPLQCLTAQAAITGIAMRHGLLRTRAGQGGLALSAVSAAGLIAHERRGRQAAVHLEAALADALGPGYRSRIRYPRRPGPRAAPPRRSGVLCMRRIRREYAHSADISYGPHGRNNLLDIWRRPDLPRGARAPVLLQVPGGAWVVGNKEGQAYPLMSHLAEQGWVCASMSYRLSPKATWPAQIVDVKRALAWVKDHIADYGGDPRFVAITGGSAGGHLSALAALSAGDPAFQPGFEDADTSVQAAVPFYGIYDWTPLYGRNGMEDFLLRFGIMKQRYAANPDLYEQASPLLRAGPQAPPFFILHGGQDVLAPVQQARLFASRLREAGGPVVYAELPGAQHAFDIAGTPRAAAAAEAVGRFLGVIYGNWSRNPGAPDHCPSPASRRSGNADSIERGG